MKNFKTIASYFLKNIYIRKTGIIANNDEVFMEASENDNLKIVKYIVEQGANIHVYNDGVLKLAARCGHLEIVNYLRKIAGDKWKCNRCVVRACCLDICKDYKNET